jgi:hypothetical protein
MPWLCLGSMVWAAFVHHKVYAINNAELLTQVFVIFYNRRNQLEGERFATWLCD